ncbi:PCNA-associated factor isoform X2 [Mycteria americana]|uniref:PCNA-associated factor isoform X2 n=1 Tax=Mycteria americana TaxID=33587 RepID=UPI003F586393
MVRTKADCGGAYRKVLAARAPRKVLGSSSLNAGPSPAAKRGESGARPGLPFLPPRPACSGADGRSPRRRGLPWGGEPGVHEARPHLAEGHRRVPAVAAEGESGARCRDGGEQRVGAGRQKG